MIVTKFNVTTHNAVASTEFVYEGRGYHLYTYKCY